MIATAVNHLTMTRQKTAELSLVLESIASSPYVVFYGNIPHNVAFRDCMGSLIEQVLESRVFFSSEFLSF